MGRRASESVGDGIRVERREAAEEQLPGAAAESGGGLSSNWSARSGEGGADTDTDTRLSTVGRSTALSVSGRSVSVSVSSDADGPLSSSLERSHDSALVRAYADQAGPTPPPTLPDLDDTPAVDSEVAYS